MFKYLGQHIFDFVSKFRNKVYFENLKGSSGILNVADDGEVTKVPTANKVSSWHLSRTNKLDLNPPEANPSGITFKPDGTRMFVLGYSRNRVQQYDLSTAWDLTSAGSATESEYLVQNNLSSTQEDFFIDSSGTRMYVLSRSSDSIGQFTLNTAWDISDITFVQDVHLNSTGLSGGVAGFVTGEPDPSGLTFKPDGTILYIVGYNQDRVHQVPLSTAWDISTHGTITELSLSPANASQAIQFSLNGKEMYILDYSLDGIAHFTLSTAWDVTTANLNTLSVAFIGIDEATPTGLYYRDDLGKCFIVGRSSDFAREVIANDIYSFNEGITAPVVYSPQINTDKLTTGGGDGGSNNFYNITYARSTFQTNATTYLGYDTGPKNVRIGNTVYGNYRFHVFQYNYIDSTFINAPTTTLPNIRFFNPLIGGVGVFSIGKTHNTGSNYLLGGVTDIESEASTFDHLGEFTLGGELKISGTKPLAYKDPNLYTSGTQIVLDNFTETSDTDLLNHTPDTGSGYTRVYISSGANANDDYAKISGGNGYVSPARNNSNDGFRFTNDTTISTANYEARAVIKRQSNSDDPFVLFVKYIDEDNYFAMHFAGNYSYCTPMSVVNGVNTTHGALYYYANTSTADNVNFEVALRVVGNNVHLFYEGRYRGSREVNITGAGKAGIGFGRSNDSIYTSYDLTTSAQISKFEVYELPDSLFDGSDSVHYIENGQVAIGTTTPSANRNLTIQQSDDVNGGIELIRSNGIQKLRVHYGGLNNAGSFQQLGIIGDYGVGFLQNQNRSSGNIFEFGRISGRRITDTDAEQAFVKITPDIGQSGTANYVGLLMDVTETSVGSGTNSLMDLRVGGSSMFTVRNDGKVGIGTTSPVGILHAYSTSAPVIESPSNAAIIIRRNDNVGYSSLLKYHSGNSEKFVAGLSDSGDFTNSTGEEYFIGTTKTNPLVVLKNDGKLGIGTTNPSTKFHVDGNIRVGDVNDVIYTNKLHGLSIGDLTLYTSGNTLLTQTGNVGIGNTNPTHTVEIGTDGGGEKILKMHSDTANSYFEIQSLGNVARLLATNNTNLLLQSDGTGGYITFNANSAERMRILYNGNVGIGTTSPTEPLTVEGNISGSGNLTLNGNIYKAIENSYLGLYGGSDNTNSDGFIKIHGDSNYWGRVQTNIGYSSANSKAYWTLANSTELMTLTGAGRLGIGATSPKTIVDIRPVGITGLTMPTFGTTAYGGIHIVPSGTATTEAWYGITFGNTASGPSERERSTAGIYTSALGSYGNKLYFATSNSWSTGAVSRMMIDHNGNVGIGTTTPSEKLEVSGNIKASGTIKGKMEQMFACSFSDDLGTTKHYLSFTSNAEQTNVHADQAAMVMPYNGRVKSIQLRLSNIDADTIRTFGIETIAPGINMYASSNNWTIEETEAYELAATDDFYLVNYVFSNTSHFESGDLLAISIQDTEDAYTASRQTYVNVIIEYDLNNGMGNDTATTKYTS